MQFRWFLTMTSAMVAAVALLGLSTAAIADGTETLGTPLGITVEQGTGIVVGGTGLTESQPQSISVTVPGGATVNQVLLYWVIGTNAGDTDTEALVNGTPVTGMIIGGPSQLQTAYRADITGLGAVSAGANSLEISGLTAGDGVVWGAAALVIYSDGSDPALIDIRDGIDLAFIERPSPYDTTVPQTFTFAPSAATRTARLSMFFTSVEGSVSGGGFRPSAIVVTINGSEQVFDNVLDSLDGPEADTLNLDVTIPAGTTMLTVQALSVDNLGVGGVPASFIWSAAGLAIPPAEMQPDVCWITGGGFLNLDTGGTSGSKSFSFGGNVGPPPHGSWNVVDHDTGDKFHTNEVHITSCEVINWTGPGQPGGKKGFDLNKANFAGTGTLNGIGGCPFTGYVIDGGEPQGKKTNNNDVFHLETTDAAVCGGSFFVDGEMPGGNFQIHPPNGSL